MKARILAAIALACAVAAAAYFYMSLPSFSGQDSQPAAGAAASGAPLKPARTPPAGHKEYREQRYRFAVFVPDNLVAKSYDEGGGASTIALQDAAKAEGFQVFIVPYKEAQVSEERFRRDAPSGVRKSPKDVTIDGATATSFYGTSALLGDTAEIWFILGGPSCVI